MDSAESTASARGFIRALYGENDLVAVLAVARSDPTESPRDPPDDQADKEPVYQRIAPAGRIAADPFQRWLRHLNVQRYDIYLGMNPIRPGTKGRYKQDIAEVRRLQIDLDEAGPESLRRVLAAANAGQLPKPAIVVRSSQDRYQVLWHTDRHWTRAQAEDTMARLAQHYGGDHVTDISRVMRLPGFRNKKPDRDDAPVRWTDYAGPPVSREAFQHLPPLRVDRAPKTRCTRPRRAVALSQSERDWANVRDRLRAGEDPAQLVEQLARQRQDKPDPQYYAHRTVQRATESLLREQSPRGPTPQPARSTLRPDGPDR
ncbi:MAG: DNA-primase RepB domain-containing protein [Gemmatimonadota bacterium]|nr:DNA-primase RepB domain-containing protein [Gemmatimonadota bacterium]